jgi:exosortase
LAAIFHLASGYDTWYHCFLVPFIAAWIWYKRRDEIAAAPLGHWWSAGLGFCFLAVVLRIGELGAGGGFFGGASLVCAVAAIVALVQGRERLWRSAFAVFFLAFAIPVPLEAIGAAAFPLQQISAVTTTVACNLMGIPVIREQVVLTLQDFTVTIAGACSGMNSLFALYMVGICIIGFSRIPWYHRGWMLAAIGPIVMTGNILRLVIMEVVALFFGGDVALSFFHEGSDLIIFLLLASLLLAVKMRLEHGSQSRGKPAQATPDAATPGPLISSPTEAG